MSGIAGIYNVDGAPVDRALLQRMTDAIAHRGPDGIGRWIEGDVGFGFQNLWVTPESVGEIQPLVHPSEGVVLFDGRLDNRKQLLSLLGEGVPSRDSADPAFVWAAYKRFGDGFAEKLIGDFATTVYDIEKKRLVLARDAIGMRPLYFSRTANTFLVASEIKAILAYPGVVSKPNADMLAAYLLACFGHEREGWTFFDGVSSVLPGQMVVITPNSFLKRIYWDFGNPQPVRFKAFPEYVEAFRDVFGQAVARRLRSAYPVAVSVSGGVDSSSIFCTAETLRRQNAVAAPNVVGISLEPDGPQSDERFFLEEIERQYGTKIHRVALPQQFIVGSLRKVLIDIEAPYLRAALNSDYPFEGRVRDLGARVVLFGQWGDQVVGNRAYLIDLFQSFRLGSFWRALKEVVKWNVGDVGPGWYRREFLGSLVRRHLPRGTRRLLRGTRQRATGDRSWYTADFWKRARRAERIQEFVAPGKTAHQKLLYELVRPMYYVQAMEWTSKMSAVSHCEYAHPFFDRDLISFLLAIPGDVVCANGVPKAILRSAMRGTLPDTIANRRWKAGNTQEFNDAADRALSDFLPLLGPQMMAVQLEYVDARCLFAAVEKSRSSIHADGCKSTWQLLDLFGLELWLQAFFGTKSDILEEKHVEARTSSNDEREQHPNTISAQAALSRA